MSTPDATPRDTATGDPVLDNAPGAYVNGDGIYFNGAGEPINRDTGEPLPAGTTLDDEGYLVTGGAAAGAPASAPTDAAVAPAGEDVTSNRIGPDGLPMPEDRALPVDQMVTPDRTPRMTADESAVGEKGVIPFVACPSCTQKELSAGIIVGDTLVGTRFFLVTS